MSMVLEPDKRLKNCPFCGGLSVLRHVYFKDGSTWYNPQCETNACCMWQENFETKEEAVINWNGRIK